MDQGTPLFHQVVRNVPVLHPRHQALVSRQVRETSLASMVGTPDNEDDAEQHKEADQLDADDIPGVGLDQPVPVAEETPSIVDQKVRCRGSRMITTWSCLKSSVGRREPLGGSFAARPRGA